MPFSDAGASRSHSPTSQQMCTCIKKTKTHTQLPKASLNRPLMFTEQDPDRVSPSKSSSCAPESQKARSEYIPLETSETYNPIDNTAHGKKKMSGVEVKKKEVVKQSDCPLSDSSSSKITRETSLLRAPVLLWCPPPPPPSSSSVTSARQSLETEKHTCPCSEPGLLSDPFQH